MIFQTDMKKRNRKGKEVRELDTGERDEAE